MKVIRSGIESRAYDVRVTITRPANQTAYTAKDVVGGALTFADMGPVGGGPVMLTSGELALHITAIPSGMTSFELALYSVTPPSAVADNGAWDYAAGDRASFLGKFIIGSPVDEGSTLYVEFNGLNKQIDLTSSSLFAYLITTGGYTPAANSEVYTLTLHSVEV